MQKYTTPEQFKVFFKLTFLNALCIKAMPNIAFIKISFMILTGEQLR